MLTIIIPQQEGFDSDRNEFVQTKGGTLQLEHSLISIRKWEEKNHVNFLKNENLTTSQLLDYIKCMTINNVDDNVYRFLSKDNLNEIIKYIHDPHTATWFGPEDEKNRNHVDQQKVITAEVIYYWMIELGIPIEFQKWHINSLLTLIRVVEIKRAARNPKNKSDARTAAQRRAALNARNKARFNSRG